MDFTQALNEFRRLHALAKSDSLGEQDRRRWNELKHLLIQLDQPTEEATRPKRTP